MRWPLSKARGGSDRSRQVNGLPLANPREAMTAKRTCHNGWLTPSKASVPATPSTGARSNGSHRTVLERAFRSPIQTYAEGSVRSRAAIDVGRLSIAIEQARGCCRGSGNLERWNRRRGGVAAKRAKKASRKALR
jgi:hypothetical protein